MLKKIFRQKFVFIQRQLTESDNLAFVAMVTNLPWNEIKVQLQFRLLDPCTKPYRTCIIFYYVLDMLPLYPRTSLSNEKSRNLNIGSLTGSV